MDVHQATISVAVTDSRGKLIMECILETKAAATILEFPPGAARKFISDLRRRDLCGLVTDLLRPHVTTDERVHCQVIYVDRQEIQINRAQKAE
jgi:hypothetical protein